MRELIFLCLPEYRPLGFVLMYVRVYPTFLIVMTDGYFPCKELIIELLNQDMSCMHRVFKIVAVDFDWDG